MSSLRPSLASVILILLGACARGRKAPAADTASAAPPPPPPAAPTRVKTIAGFRTPESVLYDPALDRYFVSNINGGPLVRDDNGFIARVHPDSLGAPVTFIAGGMVNVTLHAPKGMAVVGDTLWVADIDAVRAFNVRTGAFIASLDLSGMGASFLNDVAIGPDGALYITDTGTDRIFRVAGRTTTVALADPTLGGPNGIVWDDAARRFDIVGYGAAKSVFAWAPGDPAARKLFDGAGQFDGVALLPGGRILVSSWADSTVHAYTPAGGDFALVSHVPAPADIGIDGRRNRLLIPRFQSDVVEVWQLH
jgi:sugar lactone lactonase YvrE